MAFTDDTAVGFTAPDGRRLSVAIVGGTPAGTKVAAVLLERFGCVPVSAPTGEAILALLRREAPVDLVAIDLSVPDMDGIVAVQLIRALGARGELPVIALTEDRALLTQTRARAAGFAAIVMKPYSPRELYEAIATAVARRRRIPTARA